MPRSSFLSFRTYSVRRTSRAGRSRDSVHIIPWLASPLDETSVLSPRLRQRTDAGPIELFYDVFLVANLATFLATHEIIDIKAVWSYVGFVGIVWFTWLQVALFDLRFSKDSIFERTCKVVQLCAMIGFASAGARFSTSIQDENVWAFKSLSVLLSGSRFMLALQYTINLWFIHDKIYGAMKGVLVIIGVLFVTGLMYLVLYFVFGPNEPHIWTAWFGLFLLESLVIIAVSTYTPGLELDNTHLTTRMGLLTLIIIGEHVISITRIVNKMIAGGGWTLASLLHVMGVVATVYLLWHSYYDISPRQRYGRIRQQIWTHLHFLFHMCIILSSEGCQILTLALDISLKLRYLLETMHFACEEPRPEKSFALNLLNRTIVDMEIDFSRSPQENDAITLVMTGLWKLKDICPAGNSTEATRYGILEDQGRSLSGNVTVALFSSMGILPKEPESMSSDGMRYVKVYLGLLTFVYIYYFVTVGLVMAYFAVFTFLTRRHPRHLYNAIAVGFRLLCATVLLSQVAFARDFNLTYKYMTHPIILYTFSLNMLSVLLVDRLLDSIAEVRKKEETTRQSSTRSTAPMVALDEDETCLYDG